MLRPPCRPPGFTYLSVIILVAIIGLVSAAGLKMGALLQRRAAEQELLDIGAQFSDALQSYASVTPAGQPPQPPTLKALLRDPRFPNARRHLRKIFVDPITGKAEWGILYLSGDVGVIGVYSLSNAPPIKVGNFDERFQSFEGKSHLSDWKFTATGQEVAAIAPTGHPATQPVPPAPLPTPTATPPAPTPPPEPPIPANDEILPVPSTAPDSREE